MNDLLFFGVESDRILFLTTQHTNLSTTIAVIDERLKELDEERTELDEKTGKDLQRCHEKAEQLAAQAADCKSKQNRCKQEAEGLEAQIDSMGSRLATQLSGLLSSDSLTVEQITDKAKKARLAFEKAGGDLSRIHNVRRKLEQRLDELQAPFADIAFAHSRLTANRAEAVEQRQSVESDLERILADAITDVPAATLAASFRRLKIMDITLADIFELRRELRAMASTDALRPPPLPAELEPLDIALQRGFSRKSANGRGMVAVSGSGKTKVRRSRTVRNSDGRMQTEYYTEKVRVNFDGNVSAAFTVDTVQWSSSALSDCMSDWVKTHLQQGADSVEAKQAAGLSKGAAAVLAALRARLQLPAVAASA
jgi:hypothetical protein